MEAEPLVLARVARSCHPERRRPIRSRMGRWSQRTPNSV